MGWFSINVSSVHNHASATSLSYSAYAWLFTFCCLCRRPSGSLSLHTYLTYPVLSFIFLLTLSALGSWNTIFITRSLTAELVLNYYQEWNAHLHCSYHSFFPDWFSRPLDFGSAVPWYQ